MQDHPHPVTRMAPPRALTPQELAPLSLPDSSSPAGPNAQGTGESLLEQLANALHSREVKYCQWKGHWSAHRWSRGYGDVDLLVDHAAIADFRAVAAQLGFKLAIPGGERQIPAVEHYIGHDPRVPRLLHLHVHYRLVLGEYWKRVYRIPVEREILEHSVPGQPFRVPSPTHSFLIFVLRMLLRQVGRPLLSAHSRWLGGIQVPLAAMEAAADRGELARLLNQHLPPIDLPFFERCVRSLESQSGRLERFLLPWQLHLRLRAHVRRPPVGSMVTAVLEKFLPPALASWVADSRMRPSGGGLVVALTGGDDSGKSTCARELHGWLAAEFPTMRADLGNPPKSLLSMLAGAALEVQHGLERRLHRSARPGSYLELLRHVCTARDRSRLYQRVHRFAVAGGIAVCEGYPIRPNYVHVAPVTPGPLPENADWLANRLRRAEASYYESVLGPDALFVLMVDPVVAQRKPEEPSDDVLRQLKTRIWSLL